MDLIFIHPPGIPSHLNKNLHITIAEEPVSSVAALASIPIAFEVDRVFDVADGEGDTGFILSERKLGTPYLKDYDAIGGEGPAQWSRTFNIANWGHIAAYAGGELIGGAAIAFNTPGVNMLEGRADLAVLWDIRVAPHARGMGVGNALFAAAETWAQTRGCRRLKIETQNINVPACRFYARQGCVLGGVNRDAYPELPDEIQLLWYKDLSQPANPG